MVHAPVEEQQLFLGTKYFVRVVQRWVVSLNSVYEGISCEQSRVVQERPGSEVGRDSRATLPLSRRDP